MSEELALEGLTAAEGEAELGEFTKGLSKDLEGELAQQMEGLTDNVLGDLGPDVPSKIQIEIKVEITIKMPEIEASVAGDTRSAVNDQVTKSGSGGNPFDREMGKTRNSMGVDDAPETLKQTTADALKGNTPEGTPDPANLNDENIAKASENAVGEVTENFEKDIGESLNKASKDISEKYGADPETAGEVGDTVQESTVKPEDRAKVNDLSKDIAEDKGTPEQKSLKDRLMKVFGWGVKLAAVVAAIMMLFPGGRKLLGKAAKGIEGPIKGGLHGLGDIAKKVWAEVKKVIKKILGTIVDFFKKFFWIFLLILGVIIGYYVIKWWLTRKAQEGKVISIVETKK